MKIQYLLPVLAGVSFLAFFSYNFTRALFSDSGSITGNTFAAAAVFPSATPSASLTPTPSIGSGPSTTPTPTPVSIANHIVISEIQIRSNDATNSASHDFIELYNPTNSPLDLNGMRLVKRTMTATDSANIKVWSSSTIVAAHGYYLWANSQDGFAASLTADASSTDNISSDNSIAILNGTITNGTIVDAVAWGSNHTLPLVEGTSFAPNPTAGQSIERKAYVTSTTTSMTGADATKGNGFDTDHNATDFVLRSVSQPQNSSSPTEIP